MAYTKTTINSFKFCITVQKIIFTGVSLLFDRIILKLTYTLLVNSLLLGIIQLDLNRYFLNKII